MMGWQMKICRLFFRSWLAKAEKFVLYRWNDPDEKYSPSRDTLTATEPTSGG